MQTPGVYWMTSTPCLLQKIELGQRDKRPWDASFFSVYRHLWVTRNEKCWGTFLVDKQKHLQQYWQSSHQFLLVWCIWLYACALPGKQLIGSHTPSHPIPHHPKIEGNLLILWDTESSQKFPVHHCLTFPKTTWGKLFVPFKTAPDKPQDRLTDAQQRPIFISPWTTS